MKKKAFVICLLVFFFCQPNELFSQTFNADLTAGINWSHVSQLGDGLNRSGFVYELGLSFYPENKKTVWKLGMLYRESGWAESFQLIPEKEKKGLSIQWIELPFTISFLDWADVHKNEKDFHRIQYSFGISPARLLSLKLLDYHPSPSVNKEEIEQAFRRYNLNWLIKTSVFFHPNWSINLQFSRSVFELINSENAKTLNLRGLRQSLLTASFSFHL